MADENTVGPPYGPVSNLKAIFDTWRDRSMPEQLGREWLERIGISTNLTAKNIHALRFLGLIDSDGYTTDAAARLRTASSEEYPLVLEEIIRKAYRRIFELRNPSEDSRTRVEDAFRHEQPQAQRSRMVACFLGLCALAQIPLKEAPPIRENPAPRQGPRKVRAAPTEAPLLEPPIHTLGNIGSERVLPQSKRLLILPGSFDPILAGLIDTLPQVETVGELEEWYSVFKAAFGYVKNMKDKTKNEAGG